MKPKSHSKSLHSKDNDKLSTIPNDEIVIGKIYANWCGHCQNMGDGFKQVGNIVISKYRSDSNKKHTGKSSGGGKNIKLLEIEESKKDEIITELNRRYFGGADKVKCNGYPTVFMISGGNIEYYNGNTNFTDSSEGEKNKKSFQKWIERLIKPHTLQNGGWRWSAKNKKNASQSRRRSTKSRRTRSHRTRTTSKKSTILSTLTGITPLRI